MASGQTSNFGLNQWEPGDQVLREEFNADNVKIDQALNGLAGQMGTLSAQLPMVKLKEFTITESTHSYQLDMAGIDPRAYFGLRFFVRGPGASTGGAGLRLNGLDAGYEAYSASSTGGSSAWTVIPVASLGGFIGHVDLYPMEGWTIFFTNSMYINDMKPRGIWHKGIQAGMAYGEIRRIDLACIREEGLLAPGTFVAMYGLRG